MASFTPPSDEAVRAAASPGMLKIARRVAAAAGPRFTWSEHREPGTVKVRREGDNYAFTSYVGTIHLDEFGHGPTPPSGAMRSAAAENGRFIPADKP